MPTHDYCNKLKPNKRQELVVVCTYKRTALSLDHFAKSLPHVQGQATETPVSDTPLSLTKQVSYKSTNKKTVPTCLSAAHNYECKLT